MFDIVQVGALGDRGGEERRAEGGTDALKNKEHTGTHVGPQMSMEVTCRAAGPGGESVKVTLTIHAARSYSFAGVEPGGHRPQ